MNVVLYTSDREGPALRSNGEIEWVGDLVWSEMRIAQVSVL
jgi:hypothetical protein